MEQLLTNLPTLAIVVVGVPGVLAAYIVGGELLLFRLPERAQPAMRPWIWLAPALLLLGGFLVVPVLATLVTSFQDNHGAFIGYQNYARQFSDFPAGEAWIAIRNSLFWLIFFTLFVLAFGLVLAVLFDRLPYESAAKALIFMPLAISSVALGVIWKFMFWYQPPGETQTGTLNAFITSALHQDPRAWLQDPTINNFALIGAAGWGITGLSMVILSAALKGIPAELIEAARVDGAGELTIFRRVIFPLIMPTVVVVGSTVVIFALKAFDVVYVMTDGNFDTDVLALRMYNLLYLSNNYGAASAVAVVLLVAVIPVLVFNLRQVHSVEAIR